MTSLRCLIVVGLFGLAPVLCDHEKNGDGLTCSERCRQVYGYINGKVQGTRIFITIGAIDDNEVTITAKGNSLAHKYERGQEKCGCKISSELEVLLKSKKLNDAQWKEVEYHLHNQQLLKVRKWVEQHTGEKVQFLGAEEQNKSPNTGPVSSGKEKKREHELSEEECKDKCHKEAGYRLVETKDKVVRAWITEGYIRQSRIWSRSKKCECKSSEVLMNYLHHKNINTRIFEKLRKQSEWEKMKTWLKGHELSLLVHGQGSDDDAPVEDETSCTEKCRKLHGYIDGATKGSLIFLMIGVINDNKFIKVHEELQKDLDECECRINPSLKNLLESKGLNIKEFEEANNENKANKWLLAYMGKQVHFLDSEKHKKSPNTPGPKDLLTVEGCEEHCLKEEGYIELSSQLQLQLANGKVVESCMGSKCECKINKKFLEYLNRKGQSSHTFRLWRTLGKAQNWLIEHKIDIKFPVSSRPLPPPREHKHQHLPKQKNNHSTSPSDQTHHHLPPLPKQKHQLSPPLAAHEHERMQCRLSPSTRPSSERTCTHTCQKSYGYITGGDSGSKIYVTIGIGTKGSCECQPNEELKPRIGDELYKAFKKALEEDVAEGLNVLRDNGFAIHFDDPKTKS